MQPSSSDPYFRKAENIEKDFRISLQHKSLPIDFSPCRIDFCLVFVCSEGFAEIEVDLRSFRLVPADIVVIFPGQILAINEKSVDFSIAWFSFANLIIDQILFRFPTSFIEFLRESVKYHLPEKEKDQIYAEYFKILYKKFSDAENVCRGEIITNLLHNFYMDLYNKVCKTNDIFFRQRKRKKEVQEEFFRLVKTNTENREVAFYAGKLCITPKYLSIITKEGVGTSAKELIDKFAITELKLRLKSSSAQLKEIAEQLNYPSEAFLCKYFKRHTGMTPSHYRNTTK